MVVRIPAAALFRDVQLRSTLQLALDASAQCLETKHQNAASTLLQLRGHVPTLSPEKVSCSQKCSEQM